MSSLTMWDTATPFVQCVRRRVACERCGKIIAPSRHFHRNGHAAKYCSETCRKRAERARWKAKWKKLGVNKYIGGAE